MYCKLRYNILLPLFRGSLADLLYWRYVNSVEKSIYYHTYTTVVDVEPNKKLPDVEVDENP